MDIPVLEYMPRNWQCKVKNYCILTLTDPHALVKVCLDLDEDMIFYMVTTHVCENEQLAFMLPIEYIGPKLKTAIRKHLLKRALHPQPSVFDKIINIAMLELEAMLVLVSYARMFEKAARKIQCKWRAANANPYHPICQKRLLREYHELVD